MDYKKLLFTGAAGFIGHALSKKLLEQGHEVYGLDNINDYNMVDLKYARLNDLELSTEDAEKLKTPTFSSFYSYFKTIRMNLKEKEGITTFFKKEQFDAVIHLSVQAGVCYYLDNPTFYIDSQLTGFVNKLESYSHHKIKHLVYASNSSVYGENERVDNPKRLYAATKKQIN